MGTPHKLVSALAGLVLAGAAALVTVVTVDALPAAALANGLALTPPMGFNNWNATKCSADFNETMVKAIADIFVSRGLKDAGYQYVNIDDCWAEPSRDASGNLVPNHTRFPNGIKAVADYVHSKGLKFGIYSSAGTRTCNAAGGFPGGLGHEKQDANLWASWGVDYLKYDNCGAGGNTQARYTAMRDALKATGRPIVYSICEWGSTTPKVWTWGADVGNLWRTTADIHDVWSEVIRNLHINEALAQYAGPGHWNDPDMLEVGNGALTDTEYRSHFSLWAMMAAPLLIGTDLRTASAATLAILGNRDVIAVDQDSLGKQGVLVKRTNGLGVYAKQLAGGDRAVALFNESGATATISTSTAEVGLGGASSYTLTDLWSKATRSTSGTISASVPSHGTVMYRVSAAGASSRPPTTASPTSVPPTTASPTSVPPTSVPPTSVPPTTPAGSGCRASYAVVSSWPGGFQATVVVTNNAASTMDSWSVRLTLASGQSISSLWNGVLTGTTGTVTVANTSYNGTIAPGASVSFGYTGTGDGSLAPGAVTCTGT